MSPTVLLTIYKLTVQSGAGRLRDFSLRADRGLLFLMHSEDRWKISSLFKVLAGQEAPLEGEVRFGGNGIGLVLSDDQLPEWSTIRHELELYAKLTGVAMETMERLMEAWNLEGIYALPVASLSHYERKAFFLVLECAGKPDLLICQEPLEGLNPRQQRKVLSNLNQYASEGRIVILGTVDPSQYPGTIPRIGLDRTGQEYDEVHFSLAGGPSMGLKEAQELDPQTVPPSEGAPTSSGSTAGNLKEGPYAKDFRSNLPDSAEVSRSSQGTGLPPGHENYHAFRPFENSSPKILSSTESFGGRRLLTIHLSLPVSEETEFKLRRISEVKYFQSAEEGYEVDVLEEEQADLSKRLQEMGLGRGGDPEAPRRDDP